MIDKVLNERASRYGTFEDHSRISQKLQEVLWDCPNWGKIPLDTRQAFVVICDKMARALNGDPEYDDNFVDIIGYATLVLNRIKANNREKTEQPSTIINTDHVMDATAHSIFSQSDLDAALKREMKGLS
jgi:hypothetical protein